MFGRLRGCATICALLAIASCGDDPAVPKTPNDAPRTAPARQVLVRVDFEGNHDISDEVLLQSVKIDKAPDDETRFLSNSRVILLDQSAIELAYAERGFIKAEVDAPRITIGSDGIVEVVYPIKEGPRVRIGKLRVHEVDARGADIEPLIGRRALEDGLHVEPGAYFSQKEIAARLLAIRTLYADRGYSEVNVIPATTYVDESTLDIDLPITRGSQMTIEQVRVQGLHDILPERVKPSLSIKENEPYNHTRALASKDSLLSTGLFSKVDLSNLKGSTDTRLVVVFDVTPKDAPKEDDPAYVQSTTDANGSQKQAPPRDLFDWREARHGHNAPEPARPGVACPFSIDVRDLLSRHAREYGDAAAVKAELPRTFSGAVDALGQSGSMTIWLDTARHRTDALLGGDDPFRTWRAHVSNGVDASGVWEDDALGIVSRHQKSEAVGPAFDAWFLRREYLTTALAHEPTATCAADFDGPTVTLSFAEPSLGDPQIRLDFESAAVTSYSLSLGSEKRTAGRVTEWSKKDARGVRWPVRMSISTSFVDGIHITKIEDGLHCNGGADCLAPVNGSAIAWPPSGVVTVPFQLTHDEIVMRAKVEGQEVYAILDSGASNMSLDSTTSFGASHPASFAVSGRAATERLTFGIAEIGSIDVGELSLKSVPSAVFPVRVLDLFGARRPSIILGLPLFIAGGVRIDYANKTVTFARDAAAVRPKKGTSIPISLEREMIVADATVNGATGRFQIDTGSGNGFDLGAGWAGAHALPGDRPTVTGTAQLGAGNSAAQFVIFRPLTSSFGPIRYDRRLASVNPSAPERVLAGRIGNALFSRCSALAFDLPNRALWFEGPCDRAGEEGKTGIHLERRDDPNDAEHPWVVAAILGGTAGDRAGVRVGDRLLTVAGKSAVLDRDLFEPALTAKEGSKVPITVRRDGAIVPIEIVLASILPDPPLRKPAH